MIIILSIVVTFILCLFVGKPVFVSAEDVNQNPQGHFNLTNTPYYNISEIDFTKIVKFDGLKKSILDFDETITYKLDNKTWGICPRLKAGVNITNHLKYPVYLTDRKDNKTEKKIDIDVNENNSKMCFDMDVEKYWKIQFGENSLELETAKKNIINISFWEGEFEGNMFIELRKYDNATGTYQPVDDVYMEYNSTTDSYQFGRLENEGLYGYQFFVSSDHDFVKIQGNC